MRGFGVRDLSLGLVVWGIWVYGIRGLGLGLGDSYSRVWGLGFRVLGLRVSG